MILLAFLSQSCPACRMQMPQLDILEQQGIRVARFFHHEQQQLFAAWNIRKYPTLAWCHDVSEGQPARIVWRAEGARSAADLMPALRS